MGKIKFGTGGFRGIIGDDYNKENIQKICQAVSNIIEQDNLKKQICIGYDNRFMSEVFANWCAEVFSANDIKTEVFATATSTPVSMFATLKNNNDFGVMITASHNPYNYNGIKIFTKKGQDANLETTKRIEDEFDKISEVKTLNFQDVLDKKIFYKDYLETYINYLIKNQELTDFGKFKVIFDAKFGSTVSEIKMFCEKLNIKNYIILNSQRDAFFNFTLPAPNEDNIEQLRQMVLLEKADVGFALDADGDRLAVIDSKGNFVDNNVILALVYYFMVKYEHKKGDCVKNVSTSNLLGEVAKKFGFVCHDVPVGFKFVSEELLETNSLVGGESSGGLATNNHILGKDSLLTIALILKLMKKIEKPVCEIINELYDFVENYSKLFVEKQYRYNKNQEEKIKDIIFNKKKIVGNMNEIEKVVHSDFVKIYYKNGDWVLIRFSGTEPVLRIVMEVDSKEKADVQLSEWTKLLDL